MSSRHAMTEARLSTAARAYMTEVMQFDRAGEIDKKGQRKLGHDLVSAVVVDSLTGQVTSGRNEAPVHIGPDGSPVPLGLEPPPGAESRKLHPILHQRLASLDVANRGHPSKPGTHAEVLALNEAMWAREDWYAKHGQRDAELARSGHRVAESDMHSFALHTFWNVDSNNAQGAEGTMRRGQFAPCCMNCTHLVRGVQERVGRGIPTSMLIAASRNPEQKREKLRHSHEEKEEKLARARRPELAADVDQPVRKQQAKGTKGAKGPKVEQGTPIRPPAGSTPPVEAPHAQATSSPHRFADARMGARGALGGAGFAAVGSLWSGTASAGTQPPVLQAQGFATDLAVLGGAGGAGAVIEEHVVRSVAQRSDRLFVERALPAAPAKAAPAAIDTAPPRSAGARAPVRAAPSQIVSVVGGRFAGAGVAGAAIGTGFAVFDQVGAVRRGDASVSAASGKVLDEAVVAAGAGVAGSAAGIATTAAVTALAVKSAAIGAVAGPVGAVAGFAVGMAAGYFADRALRRMQEGLRSSSPEADASVFTGGA